MTQFNDSLAADGYVFRMIVTTASQNKPNNKSTLSWSVQLIKGTGWGKHADGPHTWSASIGGSSVGSGTLASYNFTQYTTLTLGSGTVTKTHNSSGVGSWSVANASATAPPQLTTSATRRRRCETDAR